MEDGEVSVLENQEEEHEESVSSSSNWDLNVDVNVQVWRVWAVLALQNISWIIQLDSKKVQCH